MGRHPRNKDPSELNSRQSGQGILSVGAYMVFKSNSFYDRDELENLGFPQLGYNVFVSRYARLYGIEHLSISSNVRIDDFCVISVRQPSTIGNYVHIGTSVSMHCPRGFDIGDFAGISSGSRIFGASDSFTEGFLMHSLVPIEFRKVSESRIQLRNFSQIGANCVILPTAFLAEGAVLGANSMLKSRTQKWGVYGGVPAKKIGLRSKVVNLPKPSTEFE